jgi:hypothetical protein
MVRRPTTTTFSESTQCSRAHAATPSSAQFNAGLSTYLLSMPFKQMFRRSSASKTGAASARFSYVSKQNTCKIVVTTPYDAHEMMKINQKT